MLQPNLLMNGIYREITAEFAKNGDKKRAISSKKYHKYKIHNLGVGAPIKHRIFKKFKIEIKNLNCQEALILARKLYTTKIEEFALAGSYILQIKSGCLGIKQLPYLDKSLDYLTSWSTIDSFCIDVLQPILLKHPKETINLLKRWNKSENMWKRRASVVAFVRKIGESGKFTDMVLKLCDNLIDDKEDLVRKGVGWALKDNMRGSKKKVFAYVKNLREKKISSTIILYAIRDLKDIEKKEILYT